MHLTLKDQPSRDYVISLFHDYLLREHRSDIIRISAALADAHHSVVVHFNCLCEFNSIFSDLLLVRPSETLALLDEGLRVALNVDRSENGRPSNSCNITNVHVRLTALPVIPEVHRDVIPRSSEVGRFIALRATVSRVGAVQVFKGRTSFTCSNCGHVCTVDSNFENQFILKPPRYCPNRGEGCHLLTFKPSSDNSFCAKNYQEIRVHERFRCLSVGVMPKSICVCLEDDLLESVKPGDDVVINGVVTRRWCSPREGSPCGILLCIRANYIENLSELKTGLTSTRISGERVAEFESFWSKKITFAEKMEARNQLVRSICPDVCGMYLIKLSLALMLAGAPDWECSSKNQSDPTELRPRTRGSSHILLLGDPGTAKSVLLRAATNLSHRAVLTTATGTTAAGLTAAAVRDANGWSLDAGALVLADGGLCAIDEFTALLGAHRSAVHEAMEQQTISLAKAGLMARLNCRCSILAAANPPPDGVTEGDLEGFGLSTPLLSRFDLIWRLIDPVDSAKWDQQIANFVLKLDRHQGQSEKHNAELWSTGSLREYFAWIRQEFRPQLSAGAASLLQRYYVWRRRSMGCEGGLCQPALLGRGTLRLLESLIRLTKAHARLMGRSEAQIQDAVVVIGLADASIQSTSSSSASLGSISSNSYMTTPEAIVASDVPTNAGREYLELEKSVFDVLGNINTAECDPPITEDHNPIVDRLDRSDSPARQPTPPKLAGNEGTEPSDLHPDDSVSLSCAPLLTSTQFHISPSSFEFRKPAASDSLHDEDERLDLTPFLTPLFTSTKPSEPEKSKLILNPNAPPSFSELLDDPQELDSKPIPMFTSTQRNTNFELERKTDSFSSEVPKTTVSDQMIPKMTSPYFDADRPFKSKPIAPPTDIIGTGDGDSDTPTDLGAAKRPLFEKPTNWSQRISSKLARFASNSPVANKKCHLEIENPPQDSGNLKENVAYQPSEERTRKNELSFDFSTALPSHVQLTNEDFEIDL